MREAEPQQRGKQAEELIRSVERLVQVNEDSPLYKISFHKYLEGELLNIHQASIELVNISRPIVAISVYITFLWTCLASVS